MEKEEYKVNRKRKKKCFSKFILKTIYTDFIFSRLS